MMATKGTSTRASTITGVSFIVEIQNSIFSQFSHNLLYRLPSSTNATICRGVYQWPLKPCIREDKLAKSQTLWVVAVWWWTGTV